MPAQVLRVVAPLSPSTSRSTLHTVLRLSSAVLAELTDFGAFSGQSRSCPNASPGWMAAGLTGIAFPAWPTLIRSLLLSSSFAVKSDTGATRPSRTR